VRRGLAGLAASLGVLAAAPAGASAVPPPGCTTPDVGTIREYTCYIDPITVAGYEVKQDIVIFVPKPEVDGHITKFVTDAVDENGVPIPIDRLMLHHIVFNNLSRGDRTCTGAGFSGFDGRPIFGGYAPERFAGAGEERAKLSLPDGYGYALNGAGDDDDWAIAYMLMNHRKEADTAYVQYKLTVDTSNTLQSVRPYWLDVNNCKADPIYNVPGLGKRAARRAGPNPTHRRSREFTVQEDGWIVAGGGHVHGGARRLTVTKPSCDNKQVAKSTPTWGLANHPFYNVRPVLHEPGPIGMSGFNTPTGIPVRDGQHLRLNSFYDNAKPHTRVMGIYVVYIAADPPGGPTPQTCGGAPDDTVYSPGTSLPGRSTPVPFRIPLTGIDEDGNAVTIAGPPGPFTRLSSGATVTVGDRFFGRPNIVLRRGAMLRYDFSGAELHNLTLANGPLGIGSPNLDSDRDFTQRFTRPGTYRFFCGLHPTQMSQRVVVKKRRHRSR
jgi:hypothetical protein